MAMKRRHFLQTIGAATPAISAGPAGAQGSRPSMEEAQGGERRVFIRDDGRHAAGFDQFAPPLSRADLTMVVDQLAGSGVNTILFSAGVEGGRVNYPSRVGQLLGDNVVRWTHAVHYRDARHLRQIIADGLDRIALLCERCHDRGVWFLPGVPIDIGSYISPPGHGRTSDFVLEHSSYQVGEDNDPRAEGLPVTRFSFLHPEVRRERFRIFEELLSRFQTDGVEVASDYFPGCTFGEAGRLAPVMTQWLRELQRVADRASKAQGRPKRIYVRLPADPKTWPVIGYEVERWVREQIVDGLICTSATPGLCDQDLDLRPVVELTSGTPCRVLAACGRALGREQASKATTPMIWAAAANAYHQGADGFGLDAAHWFPWPWGAEHYAALRPLGHPDLLATVDKMHRVRSQPHRRDMSNGLPGGRVLVPRPVTEGGPVEAALRISDELAHWEKLGRVESVSLRVRLTNIEPSLNQVRIELNGRPLPDSDLGHNDLTYRILRDGAAQPYGYTYEYDLSPDLYPKRGLNAVKVSLLRKDRELDLPVEVYDVDCRIRYRLHRHFEGKPVAF